VNQLSGDEQQSFSFRFVAEVETAEITDIGSLAPRRRLREVVHRSVQPNRHRSAGAGRTEA